MRIAMLAPLWKRVPPQKYGGTELVVSLLTEELVRQGHDVTLYACGQSKTSGNIVEVIEKPLFDLLGKFDFSAIQYQDFMEIKLAFDAAKEGRYDIIHNHMGLTMAALSNVAPVPMLTTNHSSLPPDFEPLALLSDDSRFVSISDSQRLMSPYLNYIATVYHGIRTADIAAEYQSGDYLLFLATLSEFKGVDRAIKIALRSGMNMIIAGDIRDPDYFSQNIKPLIDGKQIRYVGEVNEHYKNELMKHAKAYIFPVRWNEAFGLTIVEALASGTPVIAYPNGSLPELIDEGKTGFLVNSIDEAVTAVGKIDMISRKECRHQAVKRFDVSVMTANYLKIYEKMIQRK